MLRYFWVLEQNNKCLYKMNKKWLRVVLTVLETVQTQFSEIKQFIEDSIKQECLKEKISADEVIFFASLETKS